MTDTVVSEGQVKFRDGKKWKSRWVVVQKPSPVADCLSVLVYKDKKKGKQKAVGRKDPLSLTLEGICGVEPGPGYDGVCYTLSVLCLAHTLILGFRSRDALQAWDSRLRYSLGEVHSFSINVEPGTKLQSGPATLHLCNNLLTLSRSLPPIVFGYWKLSALRRYGAVPNGFVFEGGTRCGYWAGVFFLSCSEGENISFLFDCVVRGIAPSRVPRGLQPALPDPTADPLAAEERINQEASELEKRLSMLSTCSLAISAASTYSCSTSVAGDDHSSISSSSSSQSDTSYGKKLPFWADPLAKLHLSSETASSSSTLKAMTSSDDRLYVAGGSVTRPPSSHLRGLHDSGRQSSLDSGIGIATGSQSSYTGSVSSCTGSQDITSHAGGEEFGSFGSLPAAPPSSPPPPPAFQSTLATSSCSLRSSSSASQSHGEDYRVPSLLGLHYDTPRGVSQRASEATRGTADLSGSRWRGEDAVESQGQRLLSSLTGTQQLQAGMQRSLSWGSERAPPLDPERTNTLFTEEHENYITAEQWRLRSGGLQQVGSPPSSPVPPPSSPDPLLSLAEERRDLREAASQRRPLSPFLPLSLSTHWSAAGNRDLRPYEESDSAYVNIAKVNTAMANGWLSRPHSANRGDPTANSSALPPPWKPRTTN
ncbi:protein Dok-7-like [Synchiropus splendidus]|uniref:protein Dok-7-like n=1 Tax=Synchiropus splendidus TaxID=270530 RepID=UPI00237E47FD|nr:protein Dok-7-like [Synchiropus splendidus]